jgi:hypothetical protein
MYAYSIQKNAFPSLFVFDGLARNSLQAAVNERFILIQFCQWDLAPSWKGGAAEMLPISGIVKERLFFAPERDMA